MRLRGKYLRKRYSARPIRLSRKAKKMEGLLIHIAAVIGLVILLLFIRGLFTQPDKRVQINETDVATCNIPYKSLTDFKTLSEKYGISFAELVAVYSLENRFFPTKTNAPTVAELEQNFIMRYDSIKSTLDKKQIEEFKTMFDNILSDIKYFPLPTGYDSDQNASYMFGDSYGAQRQYSGDRLHEGTDILDRENIRGRIPVVSMTAGTIQSIGWTEVGGFCILIRSENGTTYYYAHLNRFEEGLVVGSKVTPAQMLGYMGDSGYGKKEGTVGNFPVHLHIGISPDVSFTKKEFWINPYPFLRLIEGTKLDLKASS